MAMAFLLPILLSSLFLSMPVPSFSITYTNLTKGSSLSTQDVLISIPDGIFTAGFFAVGENSYCFSIWFTKKSRNGDYTVVWMANRDQPINGKRSDLSLQESGNLLLKDAGQLNVWRSKTQSNSSVELKLHDNGNLVLSTSDYGKKFILWQSFDFPTDTLLPGQLFTGETVLVSARSTTNYSSGFYRLYFDSDSVLHLRYEGPEITTVFWPDPWTNIWDAGRSSFNSSKIAVLDESGYFQSSDLLQFNTSDRGVGPMRRLVLDVDGCLRVHSLDRANGSWQVTWLHNSEPCKIHGICGTNSLCVYDPEVGRKCICIPGYRMRNRTDWSYGCEPEFNVSCSNRSASGFVRLPHVEFYGYDIGYYPDYSFESCKSLCLNYCECKGVQFKFDQVNGYYSCFPKTVLFNGYRSQSFEDPVYIRLPAANVTALQNYDPDFGLQCIDHVTTVDMHYKKKKHDWMRPFLWFTSAVGAIEMVCLLAYLFTTRRKSSPRIQGYLQVATGFRRFTYAEMKNASRNFSEEIGRGGSGVVYAGVLSDGRVAAIKYLKEAIQGEAEFLAEMSTIGRLNHMNLIEIWGYCAEGKHKLLVYEYMEHGSLAKILYSDELDWKKRYEIALGTARGLAYLHEECLEWVLHCDVKPQNILLNSDYQPKVADFGLSKILKRSATDIDNSMFSKIRGTRGYMAPEWVYNLPITSKVDVYSYGIVMLEMITGWRSTGNHNVNDGSSVVDPRKLVTWVKENIGGSTDDGRMSQIKDIVDPSMNGDFDMRKMEILIDVALKCAEEDKDARPSMRQVVDMLLHED